MIKRTQGRGLREISDTPENHEKLEKLRDAYVAYGNTVMTRLDTYPNNHGHWHKINGVGNKDHIFDRIVALIGQYADKPRNRNGARGKKHLWGESITLPS